MEQPWYTLQDSPFWVKNTLDDNHASGYQTTIFVLTKVLKISIQGEDHGALFQNLNIIHKNGCY
jgi:hypothetical protein